MKIQEVFVKTGEVIIRDMTPEELAQRKLDDDVAQAELNAKATKEIARKALLVKLGITEEEARLLLGGN